MLDADDLLNHLTLDSAGIYRAGGSDKVSYPEDGHANCFQVEDNSFWFKHRNECIRHVISSYPATGVMLDLGGGNGFVSKMLADAGYDVVLLEPGSTGAWNARTQRGLSHVVCAPIEDAGFQPESFGSIGMFDVIEHIEDDRRFLERIAPLIKHGGMLYLTVPCYQQLWSAADVRAGHFRRHTKTSICRLIEGLFELEYFSYTFRPLMLPLFALRALPYRLGLRRSQLISTTTEHGGNGGRLAGILKVALQAEASRIASGKRLAFGASCVVAARRI